MLDDKVRCREGVAICVKSAGHSSENNYCTEHGNKKTVLLYLLDQMDKKL